jgi:hypothetical protein
MPTLTASETVTLHGGCCVPLPALRLLWNLEARDLTIRLDAHGGLLVGPRHQLSDDDRANIREHRDALIQLVTYCARAIQ